MQIFITIDTEFWPKKEEIERNIEYNFEKDVSHYIYGMSTDGAYGLEYLLENFKKSKLKAEFFVESLCAERAGGEPIVDIVKKVYNEHQSVQLHLHPEWLQWMEDPPLKYKGCYLWDYEVEEQLLLIKKAKSNLKIAGVNSPIAFRAGNYGADLTIMEPLKELGIEYDTSLNCSYLHKGVRYPRVAYNMAPFDWKGVKEIPVSNIIDIPPKHLRHLQLCALSFNEMKTALESAYSKKWSYVTIVLHTFELVKENRNGVDRFVLRRFKKLCEFLDKNRERFETVHYKDIEEMEIKENRPVYGNISGLGVRLLEQGIRRILA